MSARSPFFPVVLYSILSFVSTTVQSASLRAPHLRPLKLDAAAKANVQHSAPAVIQYFDAYPSCQGVDMVWAAFSDNEVEGFKIYRSDNGEAFFFLVNEDGLIPVWQQEYSDDDVRPSTTYQYILSVILGSGKEILSQPLEVTTSKRSPAPRLAHKR